MFADLVTNLSHQDLRQFKKWWETVSSEDRSELTELTKAINSNFSFTLFGDESEMKLGDSVCDLYHYLVNHEIRGQSPFFGNYCRDGRWGYYRVVLAIDWPPYSESHFKKPWRPRGRFETADLGFA